MLGAIIGDIVGSRFEFNNTNRTDFELFTDECSFTDDTVCTVAVADAILREEDFGNVIHEWCNRYPNPMGGYGGRFVQWVHSDNPKPYNSFGNGSAMRVSPCGYIPRINEVMLNARKSAECTHNHPDGIKGAECVALCIALSKRHYHNVSKIDWNKERIKQLVVERYDYNLDQTCDEIRRTNTFNETCQVTVPQAIVCFLESTDFESAIRLAVSIGGDSDTIAAITGSIAEAYCGIPQQIQDKAWGYLPQEMQDIITQFYKIYG
ncbi:MAG: ADP-ribosylglycohydrolase family protein [Porphyromonas sp.]|nr:ADP-ribosylglycohydrolase family protein [Porphyromonas sp.]